MSLVRGTRGDLDSIGEEVIDIDDLPPPKDSIGEEVIDIDDLPPPKNSKETDQLLMIIIIHKR